MVKWLGGCRDEGVVEILDAAPEVLLSAVVLGELTYGALNSRAVDANLTKLSELARQCRFVPVDEPIVAEYGRVKTELKKRGRPICLYGQAHSRSKTAAEAARGFVDASNCPSSSCAKRLEADSDRDVARVA